MRISSKILGTIWVSSLLALTGCPGKSKTEATNARTEVPQLGGGSSPSAPVVVKEEDATAKPVVKDPVPKDKAKVENAGVDKKPEKTQKGEDIAVASDHVEVAPTQANVSVVIEEAPKQAAAVAPKQDAAPAQPDVVEFPAVKLPGSNETVAVGEAAEAILADPQPIQAAAAVAEETVVAMPVAFETAAPVQAEEAVVAPEAVSAEVAAVAGLDSDLGQPVPAEDAKEVKLTPDTEYKVTFVQDSKEIDVALVVTLAAEPVVKTAEQQPDGSIKLVIDPNGNPEGTLYSIAVVLPSTGEIVGYVDAATGEILKEGEQRFDELKNPTVVVKNLNEDAELVTVVVQAQNQKGEETSWSDEITVTPVADATVDDSTEIAADDTTVVDPASVGIDVATATEKDVQGKVDAAQAGLTSSKDQLKELKAKLDKIRKDLKAKNADRRDVQKKLKKLEKDAKKNQKDIDKLKTELEGVQLKIDELGKQLRDVKAQIKALQGKVKDQAAEIKKLKKVLAQMKKAAKEAAKKAKKSKKSKK